MSPMHGSTITVKTAQKVGIKCSSLRGGLFVEVWNGLFINLGIVYIIEAIIFESSNVHIDREASGCNPLLFKPM